MNVRTSHQIGRTLLVIHTALLAWLGWRNAPVYDEPGHIVAGIRIWRSGDFNLYRVNPPLIRAIATLAVTIAGPKLDWSAYRDGTAQRPEFPLGSDFITANGPRSFWYFTLARWSCIPLSILGGIVCQRWATRLYGPEAGAIAVGLWCLCPNVLAWGAAITPDLGAASLGIAAMYAFWLWLQDASWRRATICGLALGLAVLAKSSWLILFALWPILSILRMVQESRLATSASRPRSIQLLVALVIGVYVVNLGYLFEGTGLPLKRFTFVSRPLAGDGAKAESGVGGNRFAGHWSGELPVPLPQNLVLGIDVQKSDFEVGLPSYLDGEWGDRGWWYYYLFAAAWKIPLGTWALLGLACATRPTDFGTGRNDEVILLAPLVLMFVLISSQSGISRNFRYVLVCFPFAFIFASRAALLLRSGRRWLKVLVLLALAWTSASSMSVYPYSMSYFNELAGGPEAGHYRLIDTNIDWGQDLLELGQGCKAHPEAQPLRSALYGHHFDTTFAGVEPLPTPTGPPNGATTPPGVVGRSDQGPRAGWYAMSVHRLHDRDGGYDYFLKYFKPTYRIGYSIYIYHITVKEAERVRTLLGLASPGDGPGGVSPAGTVTR